MKTKIVGRHQKVLATRVMFPDLRYNLNKTGKYLAPGETMTLPRGMMTCFEPMEGENRGRLYRALMSPGAIGNLGPFFIRPLGDVTIHGPALIGEPEADRIDEIRSGNRRLVRNALLLPVAGAYSLFLILYLTYAYQDFLENPVGNSLFMALFGAAMLWVSVVKWKEADGGIKDEETFPRAFKKEEPGSISKYTPC